MLHQVIHGTKLLQPVLLRQSSSTCALSNAVYWHQKFLKSPTKTITGCPAFESAAAAATAPAATYATSSSGKSRAYPDEPRVGVGVVVFRKPVSNSAESPEVCPPCSILHPSVVKSSMWSPAQLSQVNRWHSQPCHSCTLTRACNNLPSTMACFHT